MAKKRKQIKNKNSNVKKQIISFIIKKKKSKIICLMQKN